MAQLLGSKFVTGTGPPGQFWDLLYEPYCELGLHRMTKRVSIQILDYVFASRSRQVMDDVVFSIMQQLLPAIAAFPDQELSPNRFYPLLSDMDELKFVTCPKPLSRCCFKI
jgi:hypothetical protein